MTGEQRLNGQPKTKATLARVMGYVEQNDIHTPALTVVESLQFSAHLRLDRKTNKRQESNFVDNVGFSASAQCIPYHGCKCIDLGARSGVLMCSTDSLVQAGSTWCYLCGLEVAL